MSHLDVAALTARISKADLLGKSMLLTQDFSDAEIDGVLAIAEAFDALDQQGRAPAVLPNELAYALFFDQSTRTKSAWAGAAARLGMQPVIVDGSSTQVSHGETAEETGAMLGMNSHAMGIRHDLILGAGNRFIRAMKTGIDSFLSATDAKRHVPIVNLQCDIDHPTQTMADLMWLRESFPEGIAGKKIAVSWAYSPSYAKPLSVPQGLIMLLTRFGANVTLAHPEGYQLLDMPVAAARENSAKSGGSFTVTQDMDAAFQGAHVVYPKSWGPHDLMLQKVAANEAKDKGALADIERQCLQRNAKFTDWICDARRMGLTKDGDALYMHCLPADIGDEVTSDVMAKYRVHVAREAQKKVYVIMALLAGGKVPDIAARLAAAAG